MARLIISREPRGLVEGIPPGAVVGAMSVHAVALAFLVWGTARLVFPTPAQVYQVELVAAPQPAPVRQVPVPRATRPAPKPESKPAKPRETKPAVTEKPRETTEPAEAKEEKAVETTEPEPERRPAAAPKEGGSADLPVRLEGAPFPYPEYLENLILQIKRHWRPPAGGQQLRAELAFTIFKDGSVVDVRWIRRSGNPAFDLEARGAIETAGRRRAFGPLPAGYPVDQLRVSFFFDPTRY